MQLIRTLAAWRPDVSNAADPVTAYSVALKSLGRRYLELSDEIAGPGELISPLVQTLAPQLTERLGIGTEVAGQMLVTADTRDCRNRMCAVSETTVRDTPGAVSCGLALSPSSCVKGPSRDINPPRLPRWR
jgi:hypothetical protein